MEQEVTATAKMSGENKKKASWRRWFRRTDVYIAEYILMLWVFSAFVGTLVGLWFTFFQMIGADGLEARDMAQSTAMALAGLIVLAPAGYWLYARVTGQEMMQPELRKHRARTVFLTFWMIGAVGAIVGLGVFVFSALSSMVFGYTEDVGKSFVSEVIPGVLGALTVMFAVFAIVKHATRKLSMISGVVLAVLAIALLVGNVVMVVAKKDSPLPKNQIVTCDFDAYLSNKCTYSQYMIQKQGQSNSDGGYMHTMNTNSSNSSNPFQKMENQFE